MKDVLVRIWNMQKSLDMSAYGPDPTYQTNKVYDIYLLDPIKAQTNYIYVSRHNYDNLDSIWPFAGTMSGYFYQIDNILKRPHI